MTDNISNFTEAFETQPWTGRVTSSEKGIFPWTQVSEINIGEQLQSPSNFKNHI